MKLNIIHILSGRIRGPLYIMVKGCKGGFPLRDICRPNRKKRIKNLVKFHNRMLTTRLFSRETIFLVLSYELSAGTLGLSNLLCRWSSPGRGQSPRDIDTPHAAQVGSLLFLETSGKKANFNLKKYP